MPSETGIKTAVKYGTILETADFELALLRGGCLKLPPSKERIRPLSRTAGGGGGTRLTEQN